MPDRRSRKKYSQVFSVQRGIDEYGKLSSLSETSLVLVAQTISVIDQSCNNFLDILSEFVSVLFGSVMPSLVRAPKSDHLCQCHYFFQNSIHFFHFDKRVGTRTRVKDLFRWLCVDLAQCSLSRCKQKSTSVNQSLTYNCVWYTFPGLTFLLGRCW